MNQLMGAATPAPESIGNYRITGKIGRGGMGDIYKAEQMPLRRVVALKILPPNLGRSEEFTRRFEIEAKAISLLEHQNIVSLYEYGVENEYKYFAMQFVEGEDLGKRIAHKKILPVADVISYAKQVCRGLRYAHSKNVIHRDIKPQNILIESTGTCRITDFGIAKIFQEHNITVTGMAVGTPEYMSPEQAEGLELDHQTDIYSLGIVIYEMLTKRPPFTGNNPVAIAYKQVHELPVPPSAYRRDTPKRLELIVLKALKKNKKERYHTVEAMLNDLDTVDIDEKVNAPTQVFATRVSGTEGTEKSDTTTSITSERRITDRRFGSRRRGGGEAAPYFSRDWFLDVWDAQGIAILIALAALLISILNLIRG